MDAVPAAPAVSGTVISDAASSYWLQHAPFPPFSPDLAEVVGKFLWDNVDAEHTEVELRLGRVVDLGTEERLRWPLRTPTVMEAAAGVHRFESEVAEETFTRIYQFLNARFQAAQQRTKGSPAVRYTKLVEQDNFYETPEGRVRVTVDPNAPAQVVRALQKGQRANMDVFMGIAAAWDVRINKAVEAPAVVPTGCKCSCARLKERRSYCFDLWRLELTKVKQYNEVKPDGAPYRPATPDKVSFEVELELDVPRFREEKRKHGANQQNSFHALVRMVLQYIYGMVAEASKGVAK
eukprot:GGOE01061362.1.p1 GENE.GGOE01061362.1~~GGOE01061362.1.p1  ORF type:complete len:315 (+),score=109.11 GGOE01061362.1:67-945(+)